MKHLIQCLSTSNIELLVNHLVDKGMGDIFAESSSLFQSSLNYDIELVLINYLAVRTIERIKKQKTVETEKLIKKLYQLPSTMFFSIQEIDEKFLLYLFRNPRKLGLNVEEILIEAHEDYLDYHYD